jgi:hypothetical protein
MSDLNTVNLLIHKGTTFSHILDIKDAAGAVFDLTGYSVLAKMQDSGGVILGEGVIIDLLPTITDEPNGEITLTMTPAQTSPIVGSTDEFAQTDWPDWDITINDGGGTPVITKTGVGRVQIKETIAL